VSWPTFKLTCVRSSRRRQPSGLPASLGDDEDIGDDEDATQLLKPALLEHQIRLGRDGILSGHTEKGQNLNPINSNV
jgi:hypothetical protein